MRLTAKAFAVACVAVLAMAPESVLAREPLSSKRINPYVGAVSADASTGRIIVADGEGREAYPASITKLMTALIVLEDVAAGKYTLNDLITATADVYLSEASWVGLKVGEKMSVKDMLYALMVESANDVAIALGVNSAGSLDAFVKKMNDRAASLGMTRTRYYNPNGLPPGRRYPWKKFNVTTAADQLKLAVAILKHRDILRYTSIKTCDLIKTSYGYRISVTREANKAAVESKIATGEKLIKSLRNHNNILRVDKKKVLNPDGTEAVDGLKTGYIDAGGSSIILTGTRSGKRAVVVVLGSVSSNIRDENARRLLEDTLGALVW